MKNIAQRTIELRKRLGGSRPISQAELGARINYSRTYISLVERGKAVPDQEFIDRIAALEAHGAPAQESALVVNETAQPYGFYRIREVPPPPPKEEAELITLLDDLNEMASGSHSIVTKRWLNDQIARLRGTLRDLLNATSDYLGERGQRLKEHSEAAKIRGAEHLVKSEKLVQERAKPGGDNVEGAA